MRFFGWIFHLHYRENHLRPRTASGPIQIIAELWRCQWSKKRKIPPPQNGRQNFCRRILSATPLRGSAPLRSSQKFCLLSHSVGRRLADSAHSCKRKSGFDHHRFRSPKAGAAENVGDCDRYCCQRQLWFPGLMPPLYSIHINIIYRHEQHAFTWDPFGSLTFGFLRNFSYSVSHRLFGQCRLFLDAS
jgi:hypothetical protein